MNIIQINKLLSLIKYSYFINKKLLKTRKKQSQNSITESNKLNSNDFLKQRTAKVLT